MNSISIPRSSLVLVAALLTACPGGGGTTTQTSDDSTGDTSGPEGTTNPDETTTGAPDPTTGEPDETTVSVDPCDACSPDANCSNDGTCTCKDGFSGDGQTCDDVDECGTGKDNCSPDAECTNTPGGFTCACETGFEGDGFDCEDVDECDDAGLNNCSPLADCANEDGGFECTCKEGYEGDGVTCQGNKEYGDPCEISEECASGICFGEPYNACTVQCTIEVAHDCRDQGLSGLCVATARPDLYVCAGDFNGGLDMDDTVLQAGDSAMRQFQSQTDADLFLVHHPAQDVSITVIPDPDDNIALDVYDIGGSKLGTVDAGAIGFTEAAELQQVQAAGSFYVIVRNIGNSNGSYTIETGLI